MRAAERQVTGWTEQGLAALYVDAYPDLVRLAAFLHPQAGAAEDAVQEAYVRVLAKRPNLREPDRLLAYLRAAVVNVCRGAGRHSGVAQRYLAGPGRFDAVAAGNGATDARLGDSFDRHELVMALRSLPARQREVVVLRYYAQFSEAETAAALGIRVGTVKSSAARGLDALAHKLGVRS